MQRTLNPVSYFSVLGCLAASPLQHAIILFPFPNPLLYRFGKAHFEQDGLQHTKKQGHHQQTVTGARWPLPDVVASVFL